MQDRILMLLFISLSQSFDAAYQAIEEAENNLYSCIDRHLETDIIKEKETALQTAIDCFQNRCQVCLIHLRVEVLYL